LTNLSENPMKILITGGAGIFCLNLYKRCKIYLKMINGCYNNSETTRLIMSYLHLSHWSNK